MAQKCLTYTTWYGASAEQTVVASSEDEGLPGYPGLCTGLVESTGLGLCRLGGRVLAPVLRLDAY